MKCKVDGCDQEVRYKEKQVCQKHYFRMMRNGSYELMARTRRYRVTMPGKGYQRLYEPQHPLSDNQGTVAEHRMVVFSRYGTVLPDCEICGKPTNWESCHIDHKDNDATNNRIENLRPLCSGCNTWRTYPEQHTLRRNHAITFNGETKTPQEWSRDPRVNLSGRQIVVRKMNGMSDYDALFTPKRTHNGNKK